MGLAIPLVEVAENRDFTSGRSPLTIYKFTICVYVQTKLLIASSELSERTSFFCESFKPTSVLQLSEVDIMFKLLKGRIIFNDCIEFFATMVLMLLLYLRRRHMNFFFLLFSSCYLRHFYLCLLCHDDSSFNYRWCLSIYHSCGICVYLSCSSFLIFFLFFLMSGGSKGLKLRVLYLGWGYLLLLIGSFHWMYSVMLVFRRESNL